MTMSAANKLPLQVEPLRLANARQCLMGALTLAELPRLADMLPSQQQVVEVTMQFDRDDERRAVIDLTIHAVLQLECQRTLKHYEQTFDIHSRLCPVAHDSEVTSLPVEYEPLLLHNDMVCICDVVEEELILALPIIPKQQDNDCAEADNQAYYADSESAVELKKTSPFAALADIKFE